MVDEYQKVLLHAGCLAKADWDHKSILSHPVKAISLIIKGTNFLICVSLSKAIR